MSQIIMPGGHKRLEDFKKKKGLKSAVLIIYRSFEGENGLEGWDMVPADEVPGWLKAPNIVKAMVVNGEMVQNAEHDEYWYRAEQQVTH